MLKYVSNEEMIAPAVYEPIDSEFRTQNCDDL
jgi:hypothetical protein